MLADAAWRIEAAFKNRVQLADEMTTDAGPWPARRYVGAWSAPVVQVRMPSPQNPFVRDGMLLRRTALFAVALVAGFILVPLVAPGVHKPSDFAAAAILTVLTVLAIVLLPWPRLPNWIAIVPPLLYMLVVAELYTQGGGATSGFGALILLPVLWLALYGTQAQMVASIIAAAVVAWLRRDRLAAWLNGLAAMRAGMLGALAATLVGTVANDSGALLLEIGSAYLLVFIGFVWAESQGPGSTRSIL